MRTVAFSKLGDPEFDPKLPAAYPVEERTNLLGEMPVRLRVEGRTLVAYGFRGQRVELPASSVRQVWIHPGFKGRSGARVRPALLVLDTRHRVLLTAPCAWGPGVHEVCQHLRLRKQPKVLDEELASLKVPPLRPADGHRVLRVGWGGSRVARVAAGLGPAALCVGGGIGTASLGLLLPAFIGDARVLIAVELGIAGALAGTWLYNLGSRFAAGMIRWAVASRRAGSPAPAGRFLRVTGTSAWTKLGTSVALTAAAPVLAVWGAIIEAITLSGGGPLSQGAPLGNMIAGALAILAAPPVTWLAVRRFRTTRNAVRDDFTKNFA